ncbi:helicase associated domain-containing protein [Streptomyces atroolivaceus]
MLPGAVVHGCDVGAWINRQREDTVWENLLPEQRQRLQGIGLTPLPAAPAREKAGPSSEASSRWSSTRTAPGPWPCRDPTSKPWSSTARNTP